MDDIETWSPELGSIVVFRRCCSGVASALTLIPVRASEEFLYPFGSSQYVTALAIKAKIDTLALDRT